MEEQLKVDFENYVKNSKLSSKNIELKRVNFNHFLEKGFPNKRDENWKFSDLNHIISKNIKKLSFYNDFLKSEQVDESIFINNLEHNKLVFVNGKLEKKEFNYEETNKIEIIEDFNLLNEKININSLTSLNNAFTDKHYKLVVKKNYTLKKPLVIYNITNADVTSKNLNLRFNILLEENSSLKIIDFLDDKSKNNFLNTYYKYEIKKNSILKNYKIDRKFNSNIKYFYNNINQETNSLSEIFILSLGSDFIKNQINCNLNGKYASTFVNGFISLQNLKHH